VEAPILTLSLLQAPDSKRPTCRCLTTGRDLTHAPAENGANAWHDSYQKARLVAPAAQNHKTASSTGQIAGFPCYSAPPLRAGFSLCLIAALARCLFLLVLVGRDLLLLLHRGLLSGRCRRFLGKIGGLVLLICQALPDFRHGDQVSARLVCAIARHSSARRRYFSACSRVTALPRLVAYRTNPMSVPPFQIQITTVKFWRFGRHRRAAPMAWVSPCASMQRPSAHGAARPVDGTLRQRLCSSQLAAA
jgi:hypothetical protein